MKTHIAEVRKNSLEVIRVSLSEFKGKIYSDIRIYYLADDDEWKPSRKGLMIPAKQVPELRAGLQKLESMLHNQEDDGEEE